MARCKDCIHDKVCNRDIGHGYSKCPHYVNTADVAPRADVDLYKKLNNELEDELASTYDKLENAKAEVARKIFEEIKREITDALKSNYKVLPQVEESEALWNNVNGKINALRGIEYFITELKKKYT